VTKNPEPIKKEVKQIQTKPASLVQGVALAEQGFDSTISNKLAQLGELVSKKAVIKNKEYDYFVTIKTVLGDQEFFVKGKNKKRITETDLSMIYAEALKLKRPAILVTNGLLTKNAEKWRKENTGELLKVIQL
jgi:hypothetical protein